MSLHIDRTMPGPTNWPVEWQGFPSEIQSTIATAQIAGWETTAKLSQSPIHIGELKCHYQSFIAYFRRRRTYASSLWVRAPSGRFSFWGSHFRPYGWAQTTVDSYWTVEALLERLTDGG